jgi:putative Mg2+ transporter-C (MgtC) family protein
VNELQAIGWAAVAALLGGVVGFERELASKPAGLKTHMAVALASCLIVQTGALVLAGSAHSGDPTRALHAVVTGIGFLGAGTILREPRGQRVEGLTTAASLFTAAAIGIAVGVGAWVLAVGGAVLLVSMLALASLLERALFGPGRSREDRDDRDEEHRRPR